MLRLVRAVPHILIGLLLVAQAAAQQAPPPRDTRTWYQAYADAQQKIQQRNYQGALNDLDAATRLGAPRPGKNVLFYGDVYRDYIPDYYRGMALAGLDRYDEAVQAFDRVSQAQLIGTRDSLYRQFTQQVTNAKNMAVKSAEARAAASNAAVRPNTVPPGNAPATSVNPAGVPPASTNTAGVNPANVNPATVNSPNVTPANANPTNPAPVNAGAAPNPPNVAQAAPPVFGVPPTSVVQQGVNTNGAQGNNSIGNAVANAGRQPSNARSANNAAQLPPAARGRFSGEEGPGMFMYFSGDYPAAYAEFIKQRENAPASRRTYFYLAASRAAMILTGQAPRSAMTEVRQALADAESLRQFSADLQLISPRVRQLLENPQ